MVAIRPASVYKPLTSHKFMKSMASGGLARFILLESFVEAGRTYQAYQRGGFDEGRERITEEFTGAVFWLGGVKAFNAINDKIGKWILGLRTANFDLGKDKARNPLANFLHNEVSTKSGKAFTESQIAKFKSAKLLTSILMANAMIGFVVPKLNQAITRYYHRKAPKTQTQPESPSLNMDKFLSDAKSVNKNIAFGNGASALMKFAFNLENNTTWQLLSTDIGTASGRAISARNNDERREILFRDLTSIYFYMWNMPNMNKWLNKIEQNGRGTRVDSMLADYTKDLMVDIVKEKGGSISAAELKAEMLGKATEKTSSMTVEEFKEMLKSCTPEEAAEYTRIAEKMTELQPDIAGVRKLTPDQAKRVFKGGYLNNPEFMKNIYELAFGRDKKTGKPHFLDPYKFISEGEIKQVDDDLKYFVEQIIKKAEKSGKDITADMLEKAVKVNSRYNMLNWGAGFAVSAMFLSTFIPKIQYWLTKKITGSDAFPGTAEYKKAQESKAA